MSVYRVTGRTPYRNHKPGETFEATLDPKVEARAIARNAIEVVERSKVKLVEGSYRLPAKKRKPRSRKKKPGG